MPDGVQQYCYPIVQCPAQEHFKGGTPHSGRIVLPYRAIPIPRNNRLWKVPGVFKPDWEEWFGCSECGTVRSYSAKDISWEIMERADLGDYSSPGHFYSVQASCQAEGCDEKLSFIVDMKSATADQLEARLRRGFFYGMWSCGHRLRPANESLVIRRIASLPQDPANRVAPRAAAVR